jgi:VWFA-related protein
MGRKSILKVSALFLCLAAVLMSHASAQTASVKLDLFVRDSGDAPVTGLKQEDLFVRDNGLEKQLTSFVEVSKDATPPTVVLVFDLINNNVSYSITLREKLTKILLANGGQLKYPTILSIMSSTGISGNEVPTTNGAALAKMLAQVPMGPDVNRRLAGGVGAQQRINSSIKALNITIASILKLPGRKMILWMSQGWELMGDLPLDPGQEKEMFATIMRYSAVMRHAEIALYMLNTLGSEEDVRTQQEYQLYLKGVNTPSKTSPADIGLEVLSTQSGGLVLNSNDLSLMYERCLKDAGQHYEIEFPADAVKKNVAFHEIQVKVNRPGTTVRTRNGYYAQ